MDASMRGGELMGCGGCVMILVTYAYDANNLISLLVINLIF